MLVFFDLLQADDVEELFDDAQGGEDDLVVVDVGVDYVVDCYVFCVSVLDHEDVFELVEVGGIEVIQAGSLFVGSL